MFIDPRKAFTYFNSRFRLKKSTNGWYAFKCPFCNELENRQKMAVQLNYGVCKCWVCEYQNSIIDFIIDYEGVKYGQAKLLLNEAKPSDVTFDELEGSAVRQLSTVKMPYGYKGILEESSTLAVRARNYLEKRGFDLKELDRLGVGFCNEIAKEGMAEEDDYFGYIIIPFKSKGKLVYYIGRDYIGNFLRYKNPAKEKLGVGKSELLFNEDALHIYGEVFITEGWADAFTMGRKGIATLGWSLSKSQKNKILNSPVDRLIFIPDAGGESGRSFYERAVEVAMEFIDHKEIKVIDLNGLEGKDVNEIGKEVVDSLIEKTEVLTVERATEILLGI